LGSGYGVAFSPVYIALAITFTLGCIAVIMALRYRKELIVYKDRELETNAAQQEADQANKTTISLAGITSILNGGGTQQELLEKSLHSIAKELEAGQGALYLPREVDGKRRIVLESGYALGLGESAEISFEFGEGLLGQAATTGNTLFVDDIPEGYVKIVSGLGSAYPKFLLIVPIKKNGTVDGVIELASFTRISEDQKKFVEEAGKLISDKIKKQQ
jgi:methyl-accepting chemotaxis protein